MRRIYADYSGMRISAPGYDAETDTDPSHFIFDTRNQAYFTPFLTGALSYSAIAAAANGGQAYIEIPYGQVFPHAPPCLIGVSSSHYSGVMPQMFASDLIGFGNFAIGFTSMVDRLRFFYMGTPYVVASGTITPLLNNVYYIVGQGN